MNDVAKDKEGGEPAASEGIKVASVTAVTEAPVDTKAEKKAKKAAAQLAKAVEEESDAEDEVIC